MFKAEKDRAPGVRKEVIYRDALHLKTCTTKPAFHFKNPKKVKKACRYRPCCSCNEPRGGPIERGKVG